MAACSARILVFHASYIILVSTQMAMFFPIFWAQLTPHNRLSAGVGPGIWGNFWVGGPLVLRT
jgi:hypothetical protein